MHKTVEVAAWLASACMALAAVDLAVGKLCQIFRPKGKYDAIFWRRALLLSRIGGFLYLVAVLTLAWPRPTLLVVSPAFGLIIVKRRHALVRLIEGIDMEKFKCALLTIILAVLVWIGVQLTVRPELGRYTQMKQAADDTTSCVLDTGNGSVHCTDLVKDRFISYHLYVPEGTARMDSPFPIDRAVPEEFRKKSTAAEK